MTATYVLIDNTTGDQFYGDADDVEQVLTNTYEGEPELLSAVKLLMQAVRSGEPREAHEAYLDVEVRRAM